MKRIRMFLILLLAILLAGNAFAESGSILIRAGADDVSENLNIYTAAGANGIIAVCDMNEYQYYVFNQEKQIAKFSSVTIEDGTSGHERYHSPLTLVSDARNLYAVELTLQNDASGGSTFEGAGLYRYNSENNNFEFVYDLDLSEAFVQSDGGSEYCLTCLDAAAGDGYLALLFEKNDQTGDFSFNDEDTKGFLLCFDLSNGKKYVYDLSAVHDLIAIRGNALLYAQLKTDSDDVDIMALNMQDGTQQYGMTISAEDGQRASCFAWNSEDSALLYTVGSSVLRVRSTGDAPEPVVSLSIREPEGLMILGGSMIAAWTDNAVVTASIDGQTSQSFSLTVLGSNQYLDAFALDNSDVQLAKYDGTLSVTDILLTKSSTPDVMILNTYNDVGVRQIMARGYLLPLESDTISAAASKMHSDIQSEVMMDGQVTALPYSILCQPMLGVNQQTWAQIDAQMPTTWQEMLEFLKNWPSIKAEHPEIGLFADVSDGESLQYTILNDMLSDYEQYRLASENNIGYDTETFRNLMTQFQSMDFQKIVQDETGSESSYVFFSQYQPSPSGNISEFTALLLSMDGNAPAAISASISMMVINPYSENKDAALRLLEYAAENLVPINRIQMMPEENEPIRDESYQESAEPIEQAIAEIEQRMQSANESEKTELSLQKSEYETMLAELQQGSWLASADSIAQYRKESEHISILYRETFSDQELTIMDEEKERFVQGQMTVDQYIDTLQRRYVMNTNEGD